MPEQNAADLLPPASRALEQIKEALDKTGFRFRGLPQIAFDRDDDPGQTLYLCVSVTFAVPLQSPDSAGGGVSGPGSSDSIER